MRTCISPGGETLFRTGGPPDEMLIATEDGIVFLGLDPQTGTWRETARSLRGERVSSILLDVKPGLLFAGSHDHGVFASQDGGRTWSKCGHGMDVRTVYCLAASSVGGKIRVYAGTEPAHLYVSEDLGNSWAELRSLLEAPSVNNWNFNAITYAHTKHISFHPSSAETIFVSIEVGGAYCSEDGGATWRRFEGLDPDIHRMIPMESDPGRMYLSGRDGIWRSGNHGASWEQLTDNSARVGYPDALVAHPDNPDLLFIAGAYALPRAWRQTGDCDSAILRSRDGGKSWEELRNGLPGHIKANIEAMTMTVWPGGCGVAAATLDGDVFYSQDRGDSWLLIASGLPTIGKNGRPYVVDTSGTRPAASAV